MDKDAAVSAKHQSVYGSSIKTLTRPLSSWLHLTSPSRIYLQLWKHFHAVSHTALEAGVNAFSKPTHLHLHKLNMPWVQRQPWCRCSWTDRGKDSWAWSTRQSIFQLLLTLTWRGGRRLPVWPGLRQGCRNSLMPFTTVVLQRTFSGILNCETGNGDTFLNFYTLGTPVGRSHQKNTNRTFLFKQKKNPKMLTLIPLRNSSEAVSCFYPPLPSFWIPQRAQLYLPSVTIKQASTVKERGQSNPVVTSTSPLPVLRTYVHIGRCAHVLQHYFPLYCAERPSRTPRDTAWILCSAH